MKEAFKIHGMFSWQELRTKDLEAAKKFYGNVLDWEFKTSDPKNVNYQEISVKGETIGGIMQPAYPMPTHWHHYITVDDVDAVAQKVQKAGGKTGEIMEIPGVGRFCMITDPQGASVSVITYEDLSSSV